jgi:nucleoid-associated protein
VEINEAIIHRISKESGQTAKVIPKHRKKSLPLNSQLQGLVNSLIKVYSRSTNNYGTFDPDSRSYPFSSDLNEYYSKNNLSFLDLSTQCTDYIAAKMRSSAPATGGYVLFIRYESNKRDWLLIVMLKLRGQVGIDNDTLELNESFTFDIDHLHEAARVDLAKSFTKEEPYLSFIKKTSAKQDVTIYFRNALGCTTYIQSKANTEDLLKGIESYCKKKMITGEKKREVRAKVYDYLNEKNESKQHASLKSISHIINPENLNDFYKYVKDEGIQINDTFPPYKSTYSRYKRIQSTFRSVKISFDIEDVLSQNVDIDSDGTLLIREIPQALIQEIKIARGDED